MKKILMAVVGIGLLIFQSAVASWAAWDTIGLKKDKESKQAPPPSPGNTPLYDADDQFVGIVVERSNLGTFLIFLPSLNSYAFIDFDEEAANIRPYAHLYYDVDNILYAEERMGMIIKNCGTYYKTSLEPVVVELVKELLCSPRDINPIVKKVVEVEEFDESELPFSLPISVPLRIEYTK